MFKKLLTLLTAVVVLTSACSNEPANIINVADEGSPEFIVKEWFRAISENNADRATSLIRPQYPTEQWLLLTDEAIAESVSPSLIFVEKITPTRLDTETTVTLDVEYNIEGIFQTFTTAFTADKNDDVWVVRGGYVDLHLPNIDTKLVDSYYLNNQELKTVGMFDMVNPTDTVKLPVFPGVYNIGMPNNNTYFSYTEQIIIPNQVTTFNETNEAFLRLENFTATETFADDINKRLERFIRACVTKAGEDLQQYPCSTTPDSKTMKEEYNYRFVLTRTPKVQPVIKDNVLQLQTITSAQVVKQWVETTRTKENNYSQINSPTVNYTNYSFNEQGLTINFILENYLETEETIAPAE